MVRQAGFVDLEKRLVGDMPKCDCLERITVLLDFVLLRPELERAVCPPPHAGCNRATALRDGPSNGCVVAQLQEGRGGADVLMRQPGFWQSRPNSKNALILGCLFRHQSRPGGSFQPSPPQPIPNCQIP